jgi:hypothetical protein
MFYNRRIVQVLPSTLPYDGTLLHNIETVSDAAHKMLQARFVDSHKPIAVRKSRAPEEHNRSHPSLSRRAHTLSCPFP